MAKLSQIWQWDLLQARSHGEAAGVGWGVCVLHDPSSFLMGPFYDLFWGGRFRFTAKLRGRVQRVSNTLYPYTCITSTTFNGFPPEDIFDKPTLTHCNHLRTTAALRFILVVFMFCRFEQIYNNMCPLW